LKSRENSTASRLLDQFQLQRFAAGDVFGSRPPEHDIDMFRFETVAWTNRANTLLGELLASHNILDTEQRAPKHLISLLDRMHPVGHFAK
jgi:hypothetical protein